MSIDISALIDVLTYYNSASIDVPNNGIYNLIYQPIKDGASCLIKV
jgi:hypothetical protein